MAFPLLMQDPRTNKGHANEVLPDLHPFEVNEISNGFHMCESFNTRRNHRIACSVERLWSASRFVARPSVVYHDGRGYNHVQNARYQADPCKFIRNVYPWEPKPPKFFTPCPGHYDGLSKPPVRKYFKLRPKKVVENASMPSYEILTPNNEMEYYKWQP
ncbi:uncharacterized protein LOC101860630 [Aplysia californica]|uniref:Uncharacterized protein LOC101860630 n=1 Tax=Aplysia californica TaxID=6500 RepID=A0ABM0JEU8_APLCA|nr:uncharacterized protein LOC101860630 [Aplysia californica]XP_005092115.1 uncharacterized protein LOC101860630 [Aplysia californica]